MPGEAQLHLVVCSPLSTEKFAHPLDSLDGVVMAALSSARTPVMLLETTHWNESDTPLLALPRYQLVDQMGWHWHPRTGSSSWYGRQETLSIASREGICYVGVARNMHCPDG